MNGWRGWALGVGLLFIVGGVAVWNIGGGPVLLILGVAAVITALFDPIYGQANGRPAGSGWRPTNERFVEPETGRMVTVWFEPRTGERRYVADGDKRPQ